MEKKLNLYKQFKYYSLKQLYELLQKSETIDERNFYTALYNIKLEMRLKCVLNEYRKTT